MFLLPSSPEYLEQPSLTVLVYLCILSAVFAIADRNVFKFSSNSITDLKIVSYHLSNHKKNMLSTLKDYNLMFNYIAMVCNIINLRIFIMHICVVIGTLLLQYH